MIKLFLRNFTHSFEQKQMALSLIESNPVIMFSRTTCPYCMQTKSVFKKMEIQPKIIEVDTEKEGDSIKSALKEITNQPTVPNIFIGGIHVGGYDELSEGLTSGSIQKKLKESKVPFKDIQR
ncbi:unnamed protein product [Blepharisma stoltei]|uniref:Glutaredoxin domain-containing protein n=1 Tax=Blepharisma stoltei TaxID=1481888 RepID=A0AAU9J1T1_9CILI|nr:unnamed protein product [Blepharisma stoltei]